jgi:hypothetical protein
MGHSCNPAQIWRQTRAQDMRDAAYRETLQLLRAGAIRQPKAVVILRNAYRNAALHERGAPHA